jgi:hypothetical protein
MFGLKSSADIEALTLKHTAVHDKDILSIAIQTALYIYETLKKIIEYLLKFLCGLLSRKASDS